MTLPRRRLNRSQKALLSQGDWTKVPYPHQNQSLDGQNALCNLDGLLVVSYLNNQSFTCANDHILIFPFTSYELCLNLVLQIQWLTIQVYVHIVVESKYTNYRVCTVSFACQMGGTPWDWEALPLQIQHTGLRLAWLFELHPFYLHVCLLLFLSLSGLSLNC